MSSENLFQKWKVHFSFVAGALVVSSVWGTCSYKPELPSEETPVEDVAPVDARVTPPDVVPTSTGETSPEQSVTTVTTEQVTTTTTTTEAEGFTAEQTTTR